VEVLAQDDTPKSRKVPKMLTPYVGTFDTFGASEHLPGDADELNRGLTDAADADSAKF
jgi:hypothetical protein